MSWGFPIRSQFGFVPFVFSYLAVDFVPVGFFAVHDVVDLRAEVVEEFLFFLLRGGYDRRGFLGGFLGGFAFLLELLHLVEGSVEDAGGVGSGPFDGADSFFECGVEEGVDYGVGGEFSVGEVAAAESPGGAGDLGGEVFFEDVDTFEGMVHVGDEKVVDFLFPGLDVIGLSPKTGCDGVFTRGVKPFSGARSGRLGRVTAVRVDLSFCCHCFFSF